MRLLLTKTIQDARKAADELDRVRLLLRDSQQTEQELREKLVRISCLFRAVVLSC